MSRDAWALLGLGAGAAVLFGLALGERDLWNPNEPLYGRAVAEMRDAGAWLLPTVNGERFDEKPPLYFWLALAVACLRGGVDEAGLRWPSVAAGLAAVLLLYRLVERRADAHRGRIAAALLATTFAVFWGARTVQMDLLLAATTLGAVLVADAPRSDRPLTAHRALGAGALAGLGVLAKGPVGAICPGLVLLVDALAARRPWPRILRGAALAGTACLAVAAPWFVIVALRGEGTVLGEMLWRQNVTRFLDPWDHAAPWWYYLLYFWIDMAPWAFLAPLGWGVARGAEERRLERLAWLWIAVLITFFSLSASKRSAYLLPLAPAVALLVSGPLAALDRALLPRGRARVLGAALAGLGVAFVLLGGLAWIRAPRYPALSDPLRLAGSVALLGGLAVAGSAVLRSGRAAAGFLFVTVVALYGVAAVLVLPAADAYKSARPFCEEVTARVPREDPLRAYRPWRWRASYAYYTGRTIPRIESPAELRRYWNQEQPVFLLVERGRWDEVRQILGPIAPVASAEIGSNAVYLLTNREARR